MNKKPWLIYAIITTITWGIWGAVMEFPAKWGFPETLGYITWSLTMIPCAIVALWFANWRLEYDRRSIFLGSMIGLLGAGGQLILFMALREGPAYIIFPVISLYPVLTIALSVLILKEKVKGRGQLAIALALGAILLLSYTPPSESQSAGYLWLVLATLVFVMWGLQAFVMKFSNNVMQAESIFFYMALTSVLLAPVAYAMTDFSKPIEWGLKGPYVSALIQVLNSIGALFLVYAIRYGKAIIVVPMTSLAPVITIILSLAIYGVMPNPVVIVGMVLASIAIYLLSLE
jgi:drug/metabolite transporter (DMT)-like permease